jgi:hypothetical protein
VTAVACLRVAVEAEKTGLAPEVLGPLVAKFSSAYLESRWLWPRRFAPLTHYSYLLTDPHADELDVQELARLSEALQIKLFGEAELEGGSVDLLLFEGPPDAVTAFAALDTATLTRAADDPSVLPPGGRLSRIVPPDQVVAVARNHYEPDEEDEEKDPGPDWVEMHLRAGQNWVEIDAPAMPALEGVQGVYFAPREVFIGDVVSSTPGTSRVHFSLLEGPAHMPEDAGQFDADSLAAGLRYIDQLGPSGVLYFPLSFSNLVRKTKARNYEEMLEALPVEFKPRLAAAVYDSPRDPNFAALGRLRSLLSKYFGAIDLRTTDPGFEVEKLAARAVTSVTFVLPNDNQHLRLAALRRFAARAPLFKYKKIWPGVTNLRTREELEAAVALRVPFITGPGVCRLQTLPVGGQIHGLGELPLLAA